ncbi:MAG: hypothetical protein V7459_10260 [Oceanicoccus sp.]
MRPIIIDVEASGLGRGSYPIEVGIILANGDSHCTIISREADWRHWDAGAESLHGISRETLDRHGVDVVTVARMLNQWLEGQIVYSDAWGNDSSWIALLFECAQIPQRFRLESLRRLLSDQQLAIWHNTKESLINEYGGERHRASKDAFILQETFVRTAAMTAAELVG